ncbi:uncharacterized protein ARMOST_17937 [Armillaria ostoyae]|uniref:Uncharacterized protein n=1 Tax=Armillaria ostoyae TaxID=47428 RepID=A0A284S0E2_ARMOS|nr:uncharacterized protein ARMOST_17937 [Armillaria ostoyae]
MSMAEGFIPFNYEGKDYQRLLTVSMVVHVLIRSWRMMGQTHPTTTSIP